MAKHNLPGMNFGPLQDPSFDWDPETGTSLVSGSRCPGGYARDEETLASELEGLADWGINVIVTLIPRFYGNGEEDGRYPRLVAAVERSGRFHAHYHGEAVAIEDFHSSSLERLQHILDTILAETAQKRRVLVHCSAGMGRTSFILAALHISQLNWDSLPRSITTQDINSILHRAYDIQQGPNIIRNPEGDQFRTLHEFLKRKLHENHIEIVIPEPEKIHNLTKTQLTELDLYNQDREFELSFPHH